jgi:hypothetical protein
MGEFDDIGGVPVADVPEEQGASSGAGLGEDASDRSYDIDQETFDASKLQNKKWYTFRIEKCHEGISGAGKPKLTWRVVCQTEPYVGQSMLYVCTLQRHALFNLELLFSAVKFKAPKGWTPSMLYDREFQGFVEQKMVNGTARQQLTKLKPAIIGG